MEALRDLLLLYCLLQGITVGYKDLHGRLDVEVGPEQDVLLPCYGPAGGNISVLKWSRPNRTSHGFVYFYRNHRSFHSYQHPDFQGRVQLRQTDMKDGDATLILKKVRQQDAGLYECYTSEKNQAGSSSQFIRLLVRGETHQTAEKLEFVEEEAEGNPQDAVTVGTSVSMVTAAVGVVALGSVSLWTVKRRQQQSDKRTSGAEEEALNGEETESEKIQQQRNVVDVA